MNINTDEFSQRGGAVFVLLLRIELWVMIVNLARFPALLVSALALSACGSYLPETQSGNRVQTSYLSLDQRPARGGTASILPTSVAPRTLIGPNTVANVVVEEVSAEDNPDDPSGLIMAGAVGTSAAGYAIGMAGGIALGTAMVLLGPLMLPWALDEADIAADQRIIAKSVVGYEFAEKLEKELIGVLDRTRLKMSAAAPDTYHVTLRIDRYGLVQEGIRDVLCFAFEGALKVQDDAQIHYRDTIVWNSAARNEDLPPVRCASLDEMARSAGALTKEILGEATIILSAAAIRRLMGRLR